MTTLLLVHGGLWEDMDAERFRHHAESFVRAAASFARPGGSGAA